ncbi:AAA family ATPase [Gordonia hongkongensis]|uniref:AAA family ATPase n=1 Tax=Gordonia hongkongensis TaxID=1701090 RepID=UPI003D75339C
MTHREINATDVEMTIPRWLARKRIPYGECTVLVGDENVGKSMFTAMLASVVTTGTPLPEFGIRDREPGSVLIISTEESLSEALKPRLIVAGADLGRVSFLNEVDSSDLEELKVGRRHSLIIVDSWLDTVPAKLARGMKTPKNARLAIEPWVKLARESGAAVILVCHTNRVASLEIRDTYGNTSELRKMLRNTLYCIRDDLGRFIVGVDKANNVEREPATAFEFVSVDHPLVFDTLDDEDCEKTVGMLVADEVLGMTIDEVHFNKVMALKNSGEVEAVNKYGTQEFVRNLISTNPGQTRGELVNATTGALGCSAKTVDRALKAIGVVKISRQCYLPEDLPQP